MLREEKFVFFEGKDRIRVSDILGGVVPVMRTEIGERAKVMSLAVVVLPFVTSSSVERSASLFETV